MADEQQLKPEPPAARGAKPRGMADAGTGALGHRQPTTSLTRRAIVTGMLLVIAVAVLAPYNDYVLRNSDAPEGNAPFIGNHFPIGIMTILFAMILVLNPLLMRLRVRPFSQGELVVVLTMQLIAAAAPTSGLMRYLEPMIVTPYWHIRQNPTLRQVTELLPRWLMPSTDPNSPIITDYWLGIDPVRGGHTPMLAFVVPLLLWGILIAAIFGSLLMLAAIFRRQWVHHERLAYPLATVPLELMAAPESGRYYNSRWRNPLLWTGAAVPLFVYLMAGLHAQFPALPTIDLHFQLHDAFANPPWKALPPHLSDARLYFAAVGICFFIPSEVAFSLWLFVVVDGLARVVFSSTNYDPAAHVNERSMGTYVTYFAGLLWLARGHLRNVIVAAWNGAPAAEDEPLTYRRMVVGWLVCMGIAWLWLIAVGMHWLLALLLLAVGTMLATLMARIVAETGLFFVNVNFWPRDFMGTLLSRNVLHGKSYLWTEMISGIFFADFRENLMPYATNALRMGQELTPGVHRAGAAGVKGQWFKWLIAALTVSVLVSGATNHFLSYHYGRVGMTDDDASTQLPRKALERTADRDEPATDESLAPAWENFGIGSASAIFLMVGRVMWAGWPLHPIGLVLMNSSAMQVLWFSIFFGWGVKVLLLRYGGAGAFKRARPFFIGLIVGEVMAAGIWMFVGLISDGKVIYTFLPR